MDMQIRAVDDMTTTKTHSRTTGMSTSITSTSMTCDPPTEASTRPQTGARAHVRFTTPRHEKPRRASIEILCTFTTLCTRTTLCTHSQADTRPNSSDQSTDERS